MTSPRVLPVNHRTRIPKFLFCKKGSAKRKMSVGPVVSCLNGEFNCSIDFHWGRIFVSIRFASVTRINSANLLVFDTFMIVSIYGFCKDWTRQQVWCTFWAYLLCRSVRIYAMGIDTGSKYIDYHVNIRWWWRIISNTCTFECCRNSEWTTWSLSVANLMITLFTENKSIRESALRHVI